MTLVHQARVRDDFGTKARLYFVSLLDLVGINGGGAVDQ